MQHVHNIMVFVIITCHYHKLFKFGMTEMTMFWSERLSSYTEQSLDWCRGSCDGQVV